MRMSHFLTKNRPFATGSSYAQFWAQNGPLAQIRIFSENLLMNLVSFIHAYLHAKNQSEILIY